MVNIPEKDINLIKDVASYVAKNNSVATYDEDDLRQEMFIYGMQSYSKWDNSKHAHKNESKRDKNLRLFLKDYMIKRLKNMYTSVTRNKRAVNVNVVSFDQNDPVYESLLLDNEPNKLSENDFEGLGLNSDEIAVLLYIADNDLGKKGSSKEDISKSLGINTKQLNKIIGDLKSNSTLRDYLEDQIQPI